MSKEKIDLIIEALTDINQMLLKKLSLLEGGMFKDYLYYLDGLVVRDYIVNGTLSKFDDAFIEDLIQVFTNADLDFEILTNLSNYIKIELVELKKISN